jgi:hypothetical protein
MDHLSMLRGFRERAARERDLVVGQEKATQQPLENVVAK